MTDRQEDKLTMYYTVEAACDKHTAAWQTLPAFVTHHTAFTAEVAAIAEEADNQRAGGTGATRDKSIARQAMAELAFPLGTAVQAWALITGDNQLAARVYHPVSDYFRGRDTEAEEIARLVHTEATANLAALADYGVTQPKLDALDAAITAYHAVLVKPRGAITDRKAATETMAEAFARADDILNNRLDKLVPILAADQPAFATDYRNARIIVDTGSRGSGGGDSDGDTDSSSSSSSQSSSSSEP